MVMNLKETIISSFFFHLMFLLLMIAVSNHTAGFSGDFQEIISVNLAQDLPTVSINATDKPPMAASRLPMRR